MKNLNLLYFSATGTTEKISKTLASLLARDVIIHDITMTSARKTTPVFSREDLLLVALPVYAGRVPDFLGSYLRRIRGDKTPAILLIVYGNRSYDDALGELRDILEDRGFITLAAAAFIGEHSYTKEVASSRPDREDLSLIRLFANRISDKPADKGPNDKLLLPGNQPYREPMAYNTIPIETLDSCVDCGLCSTSCPREALSRLNNRDLDLDRCIKCCRCIKNCPQNAKTISHPDHLDFLDKFIKTYGSIRREPEFFI